MEQRRLRLGDILDDYCPRERRVTNHAVVAMIEEDVKQTRCTTCDSEHAYKGARVPKRRKKETPSALYKEVLAGMPEVEEAPALAAALPAVAAAGALPSLPAVLTAQVEPAPPASPGEDLPPAFATEAMAGHADADEPSGDVPVVDGPVHRPLIRATLPRPEGQKDARPVPDFTARHVPARGSNHGGFRGGDRMRMRGGGGNGNGNSFGSGNRPQSGSRFQGNRSGGSGRPPMGRAGGSGFRNGNANSNKRGRGSRG